MKELRKQALKFVLGGIFSTILNYSFFLILLNFKIAYTISASIGFIIGTFSSFIFNKKWTFESTKGKYQIFLGYLSVYLSSLAINIILLRSLVDIGYTPVYSNAFLIPFIVALNFLGSKLIAFGDKRC